MGAVAKASNIARRFIEANHTAQMRVPWRIAARSTRVVAIGNTETERDPWTFPKRSRARRLLAFTTP
jgi:hypothetical protein